MTDDQFLSLSAHYFLSYQKFGSLNVFIFGYIAIDKENMTSKIFIIILSILTKID